MSIICHLVRACEYTCLNNNPHSPFFITVMPRARRQEHLSEALARVLQQQPGTLPAILTFLLQDLAHLPKAAFFQLAAIIKPVLAFLGEPCNGGAPLHQPTIQHLVRGLLMASIRDSMVCSLMCSSTSMKYRSPDADLAGI